MNDERADSDSGIRTVGPGGISANLTLQVAFYPRVDCLKCPFVRPESRIEFTTVNENDLAGFGDGVAINFKTAVSKHVGDYDPDGGGGIGFAIGYPVIQIGLSVLLEERPARILGRSYVPHPPSSSGFPNLPLDAFNNLVVVDRHDCSLSLES
jgi:hypothetical protein